MLEILLDEGPCTEYDGIFVLLFDIELLLEGPLPLLPLELVVLTPDLDALGFVLDFLFELDGLSLSISLDSPPRDVPPAASLDLASVRREMSLLNKLKSGLFVPPVELPVCFVSNKESDAGTGFMEATLFPWKFANDCDFEGDDLDFGAAVKRFLNVTPSNGEENSEA